jgi:hypothetical protein
MSIVPASRLSASDLVLLGNNLLPRAFIGNSRATPRTRRGEGDAPASHHGRARGGYRFAAGHPRPDGRRREMHA